MFTTIASLLKTQTENVLLWWCTHIYNSHCLILALNKVWMWHNHIQVLPLESRTHVPYLLVTINIDHIWMFKIYWLKILKISGKAHSHSHSSFSSECPAPSVAHPCWCPCLWGSRSLLLPSGGPWCWPCWCSHPAGCGLIKAHYRHLYFRVLVNVPIILSVFMSFTIVQFYFTFIHSFLRFLTDIMFTQWNNSLRFRFYIPFLSINCN